MIHQHLENSCPNPSSFTLDNGFNLLVSTEGWLGIEDTTKAYSNDQGVAFGKRRSEVDSQGNVFHFIIAEFRFSGSKSLKVIEHEDEFLSLEVSGENGKVFNAKLSIKPGKISLSAPSAFKITCRQTRQSRFAEIWHADPQHQIVNDAVPASVGADLETLSTECKELFYYNTYPRHSLCLQSDTVGSALINKITTERPMEAGYGSWEHNARGLLEEREWELQWEFSGPTSLTISVGLHSAIHSFLGRMPVPPVDASSDFGDFYLQMFTGWLPLNLARFTPTFIAPQSTVLYTVEHYAKPWSRDTFWCFELGYFANPEAIADLIAQYLVWRFEDPKSYACGCEDAEAEIILMAVRHYKLTADKEFIQRFITEYRKNAEHFEELIRAGHGLPICYGSWDGQGMPIHAKEPYMSAEFYAALLGLAGLESVLGETEYSRRWTTLALSLKETALKPYAEGGLWHPDENRFINRVDYRHPDKWGHRIGQWDGGERTESGIARTGVALYQNVIAIWLGLLDDPIAIRQLYEFIDGQYTYATGRGGVTFPPYIAQNFMALMDVCVRQKYGIPGAERLLQLILDHALDGGVPLTEKAFGAYAGCGPESPEGQYPFYPHGHTGRNWDNAPYFTLVLNIHYGLDYDSKGWQINDPKPLTNYPLTRLAGLRHGEAHYDLEWTGTGRVRDITVDGQKLNDRRLPTNLGHHRVLINLQ